MLTGTVKILLVDDHALVRGALGERLRREPAFEVVGSVSTADEAIAQISRFEPDVVVMDIDMPGLSCFDAARRIGSICPRTRLVFLSGFLTDYFVEQALAVRARGYITKREPPETVVTAIHEIVGGGAFFSEEVQARIVVDARGARLAKSARAPLSLLTPRELEMLRYIAQGLAKKEIAALTHISVKTVDRHTVNLMTKLDIHDRVELTRFAIREGLAKP